MPLEDLDGAFEELFEKGFVKKLILGPDGESDYRMTAKVFEYLDRLNQPDALKQNILKEIRK